MGTNYGFACIDCGGDVMSNQLLMIIGNCREPQELQSWLDDPGVFESIDLLKAHDFEVSRCHWYSMFEAIELVREHRAMGHTVVVVDDMGRQVDQCWGYVRCAACGGSSKPCALKHKHEGPHEAAR